MKKKKDLSILKDLTIAHRGLHNDKLPENSLGAFKAALEKNIPIEVDIHLLKSGEVVIFHDDNLKRMTGVNKNINELTYNEIKKLKLLYTDEKIPLLEEALQLVDGKVLLDIEFKCTNRAGKLEKAACGLLDYYKGDFIVKSFNPLSLLWFKINRPNFIRGQISCGFNKEKMNFFKKYILRNMCMNLITKPDFVAYDLNSITEKIVKRLKRKNIPLILWTIRSDEDLKKAKKYGSSVIYEKIIM